MVVVISFDSFNALQIVFSLNVAEVVDSFNALQIVFSLNVVQVVDCIFIQCGTNCVLKEGFTSCRFIQCFTNFPRKKKKHCDITHNAFSFYLSFCVIYAYSIYH